MFFILMESIKPRYPSKPNKIIRKCSLPWNLAVTLLLIVVHQSACHATDDATELMLYLSRFGYLSYEFNNSSSGKLIGNETLTKALTDFQSFSGLNVTGVLDEETLKLMETPRCGFPDKFPDSTGRHKRYSLGFFKWRSKELKYKVTKYSSNPELTKQQVDEDVARALKTWSDKSALYFTKVEGPEVDIDISFQTKNHGDGVPFDGRGGVLAHAFFPGPGRGGDAHFDGDEYWSIGSKPGIKLDRVATHEFGHSLGLGHSRNRDAIMYAFYKGSKAILGLHSDDIAGIQALYGSNKLKPTLNITPPTEKEKTYFTSSVKVPFRRRTTVKTTASSEETSPSSSTTTTTTTAASTTKNHSTFSRNLLCNNSFLKYIMFKDYDGKVYLLSGTFFWEGTENGFDVDKPQLIGSKWKGVHSYLDTAFSYKNQTYFFKGSISWQFNEKETKKAQPKLIRHRFHDIPNSVDVVLPVKDKIFAFRGFYYWKHPTSFTEVMAKKYPRPISAWDMNMPNNINAALTYSNGKSYFFKGNKYWRYDTENFKLDTGDPPYPRSMKDYWLNCGTQNQSPK